jgi:hypothetical protein
MRIAPHCQPRAWNAVRREKPVEGRACADAPVRAIPSRDHADLSVSKFAHVNSVTDCSANGCGNVTAKNKNSADAKRAVLARLFRRARVGVPCKSAHEKFRRMKNLAQMPEAPLRNLVRGTQTPPRGERNRGKEIAATRKNVLPDSHRRFRNLR